MTPEGESDTSGERWALALAAIVGVATAVVGVACAWLVTMSFFQEEAATFSCLSRLF